VVRSEHHTIGQTLSLWAWADKKPSAKGVGKGNSVRRNAEPLLRKFSPLRVAIAVAAAFFASLIAIVSLEMGAGWVLDGSERSLIVLMCLWCSFALVWLWPGIRGRR